MKPDGKKFFELTEAHLAYYKARADLASHPPIPQALAVVRMSFTLPPPSRGLLPPIPPFFPLSPRCLLLRRRGTRPRTRCSSSSTSAWNGPAAPSSAPSASPSCPSGRASSRSHPHPADPPHRVPADGPVWFPLGSCRLTGEVYHENASYLQCWHDEIQASLLPLPHSPSPSPSPPRAGDVDFTPRTLRWMNTAFPPPRPQPIANSRSSRRRPPPTRTSSSAAPTPAAGVTSGQRLPPIPSGLFLLPPSLPPSLHPSLPPP
jgi:hypothetical protein